MNPNTLTAEEIRLEQASFMAKVYMWMCGALMVTAATAMLVASTPALLEVIFGNRLVFYALLIGEVLLVGYISAAVRRLSASTATLLFVFYSFLNGVTLAAIFVMFTSASIASTFFITAGTFGGMSVYGYVTKRDLTSIGNLAFMALIGLILASIVNIFWQNELLYWITTYAGVLIFVALTAYDTKKIKDMNIIGNAGTEEDQKEAIMGALTLYLDFINLFLFLLRIFGRKK